MYYILHISSGTYLYRLNGMTLTLQLATFDTKQEASRSLQESVPSWRNGYLYFEYEPIHSAPEDIYGATYVLNEFEIIKIK